MENKKIIAVVGATGAQGSGLVRAILDDPQSKFSVRAITRNSGSEKAKELANYVTTRSSVFTINVVATGMRTNAAYYVEAVVDRDISPTEMLYFREGASY